MNHSFLPYCCGTAERQLVKAVGVERDDWMTNSGEKVMHKVIRQWREWTIVQRSVAQNYVKAYSEKTLQFVRKFYMVYFAHRTLIQRPLGAELGCVFNSQ